MDQREQLSTLIGRIYDAALDSTLWTEVLTGIGDFVDGHAVGLLSKNSVSKEGNAFYQVGVAPQHMQRYVETYAHFDPQSTLPLFEVEQIVSTVDLVPYGEFQEGRFYREWAEPQGFVDAANAVLEKSVASCAYLSVIRNQTQGMVDDAMRRRMAMIVPHVRRAVLISKVIDLKQAEAATFADVTDGLGAAMFLVDASARIVHANAAGDALLQERDFLRAVGGRLVAVEASTDQSLREIFAAAASGDNALGRKGIAVPLVALDGERYVGHLLPLTAGKRRDAGVKYEAVAALFVQKAALEMPSVPEVIAKTYKLTPTELRVLLAIVTVGGVPEVAATLGIGETTVKTHLGRLFDKTGSGRQADLVKLVAGFSGPLAN
jgi:DNA-binding CsgD family transcriptional regulator